MFAFPRRLITATLVLAGATAAAGAGSAALGADLPLGGSNEITIAVDPNDPNHVACASLHEIRVSTDGGATFQPPVRAVIPDGDLWAADPSVAFDSQGRLFWAYLTDLSGPGYVLWITRCDPATGEILPGYPVDVSERLGTLQTADKEWLAIDCSAGSPYTDRIHLAWTESGASHVRSTYSTDQGMSWSPVVLHGTSPSLGTTWPVHIAVAPNGDVYLAFHSQPVTHPTDGTSGRVLVSRSTDGGVTYQTPTLAFPPGAADIIWNYQYQPGALPGMRFLTQGSIQAWVLPDPNTPGRVYVVACDDPDDMHGVGDDANVYIVTSIDHGATWSAPVRIDGGPGDTPQLFPTAAIDPESGAIAVHYYDNRNGNLNPDGDFLLDVFATYSLDGGVTFFPDVQINDQAFDPNAGAPCRSGCGPIFSRVWGSSASDVFVVGFGGAILHYDGTDWSLQSSSGADTWAVWGSGPNDVFAVGDGGTIRHYDGFSWTYQASGPGALLGGVWGTAPDDVFAVGAGGAILHYDGVSWSPQTSGTTENLWDIWGSGPNDMFAVGEHGTILHYDGSWSAQSSPAGEFLGDVWGAAPDDVFVVGYQGGIYHYDGTTWSLHDSHPGRVLAGLWGNSGSDVFAVDYRGGILHFDGVGWSETSPVYNGWGIWGSSGTDAYVASENGRIYHYDGFVWAEQDNPSLPDDPTLHIGEYHGIAVAGDRAYAVWCGNDNNAAGDPISHQVIFESFGLGATGVDIASSALPGSGGSFLRQNQPNPFQSRTAIRFELPSAAHASLRIYDARGRLVRDILGRQLAAGSHSFEWDGRDDRGESMASGIYFYRLGVDDRTETRRLILVR